MKEYVLRIAQSGFAAGEVFDADAADAGAAGNADAVNAGAEGNAGAADAGAVGNADAADIWATGDVDVSDTGAVKDSEAELHRFDEAVLALKQELNTAAEKADENNAAIFEAEQMLLEDDRYAGAVRRLINERGQDALSAVRKIGYGLVEEFERSESSYIRGRSDDVKGITDRLLGLLRGDENRALTVPAIIVAEELSPLQLSGLDAALILGIITVKGTPSSHVSVIAGNLGIPYVYGSSEAIEAVRTCRRLIIDGEKVITDPEEEMYLQAVLRMEESRKRAEDSGTDDLDRRTKVYSNIAGPKDIEALLASGAEGVGLFRSEFLFLNRDSAPSEEEQFEAYRSVVEAMGEKETVIRTMDLGSDKKPSWMSFPDEKNPALGLRGLRISLKDRDLFKTQLRAMLRTAVYGNLKVMVPMVTSVREIEAIKECMKNCAEELTKEGVSFRIPPLGAMVETPAAALIAEQLAQNVDFFSIGTNDLTQYTLALDREAEGLDDFYDSCHEAVLRLIEMTAKAGAKNSIPTSVCGELAGNPSAIKSLIAAGVNKLSVSVPKVKATMRYAAEAEETLKKESARVTVAEEASGNETLHVEKATPESELRNKPGSENREYAPSSSRSELASPVDGKLIPREEIPDPAFAFGTMWQCTGIMPENGTIYAPCDGIVSGIAATKHAINFTATDGREILVHVGIDTVSLNGRGFTVLVQEGAAVSKGDIVMEVDLDVIYAAGLSPVVVVAE